MEDNHVEVALHVDHLLFSPGHRVDFVEFARSPHASQSCCDELPLVIKTCSKVSFCFGSVAFCHEFDNSIEELQASLCCLCRLLFLDTFAIDAPSHIMYFGELVHHLLEPVNRKSLELKFHQHHVFQLVLRHTCKSPRVREARLVDFKLFRSRRLEFLPGILLRWLSLQ